MATLTTIDRPGGGGPSDLLPSEPIKEVGRKAGALVIGVAAVDAFNEYVPEGHRPQDILPGARSVIVAGSQGPTAAAWQCEDHRLMEITGYDFRENVAIHVMCDTIERDYGYRALQAPSLPTAGHHPPMSMMLAAPEAARARADAVLRAISGKRFVIGERHGDASRAKLVNNLMAGIHLLAGAEAMALAERVGLDPAVMVELISASSGQSWIFDDRMPRALAGDYVPRAQTRVLAKDLSLVNVLASGLGVDLPLGSLTGSLLRSAGDEGWASHDDAAVLEFYRARFAAHMLE